MLTLPTDLIGWIEGGREHQCYLCWLNKMNHQPRRRVNIVVLKHLVVPRFLRSRINGIKYFHCFVSHNYENVNDSFPPRSKVSRGILIPVLVRNISRSYGSLTFLINTANWSSNLFYSYYKTALYINVFYIYKNSEF